MSKESVEDVGQQLLVELLKKAVEGVDAAVAFSQAQIPDVIHQLLVWNAVTSFATQVVVLILSLLLGAILYKGLRNRGTKEVKNNWRGYEYQGRSFFWDEDGDISLPGFLTCVGAFMSISFFIAVFCDNFDWLKIWLAPKLYLVQYAAELMK